MSATKLGRFEIIREIGKGAMGLVYLAHDPKIDRKIAIKMISIPAGVSADEAREARHRFVREAQAAGKLQHPNIITIYDVVEENGVSYIAMEYIDGVTLEAHTRPGALLPLKKILEITAQACSALDYAHQSNVIHRDIKPANLMLVKGELLKITDFGLAKRPDANLTQAGVLVGTPNYMSPEQIAGKPTDGRSDFFSLGVVLYELLTGERPFGGDTISTIIYRILYEDPPPPRILNDKLPVAFDGLFRKALAKDPADRFQSGGEFLEAVNNYSSSHLRSPLTNAPPTVRAVREAAVLRPGASERARTRPRAVERPATPLFAGQPFKMVALGLVMLAALLAFPRRVHEVGDGGQGASESTPPIASDRAGFVGAVAPLGSPVAPPRVGEDRITVVTDSPQARLYLDTRELNASLSRRPGSEDYTAVLKLPEGDDKEHTLVAVDGCREGSRLIQGSQREREVRLSLEPRVGDLQIDSNPSHAHVVMDAKPLGPTPLTVRDFNACEPATVVIKKEGYRDFLRSLDGSRSFREISDNLRSVSLSEIPTGLVRFSEPPPYPVEAYAGGRKVPVNPDGTLVLQEGEHTLVLKSPNVFFARSNVKVEVRGSKSTPLPVDWPGLGFLTVQAEPSNCKVFLDGELLGYAPITDQKIVAGKHVLKVVPDPDPTQVREKEITVQAGITILEPFAFTF